MALTWAMTRLSSTKLFTEDDQTTQQTIPRWSGYNSMICPHTTLPTVIGYCPMINGPSTEIITVYTVLKKAQNICFCLDQKDVVVTFDMAIYSKAKLIIWKYPDTIIRLGGFHVALNFLAVLGKSRGGSRTFFGRGCTTIIVFFFFLQNTSCIRKPQVISGGARTPYTLPLDPPLKRYQNSGIEDALIESGTYGPGTVTSLMKGKSYKRGVIGPTS